MINQLLSIVDDKLVIEKMRLKYLDGDTSHIGNYDLRGNLTVALKSTFNNVKVSGTIEADTLVVKNLITQEEEKKLDAFTFSANSDAGLRNKGLLWHNNDTTHQFVFKDEPRVLFSSLPIDLHQTANYKIDGATVLTKEKLGAGIVSSNLKKVGILEKLEVDGPVNLANVVLVNSQFGRVGINTEVLHRAVTVLENSVEVIIGAEESRRAVIGTNTAHALDIVTDNTARISLEGTTVTIGSPKSKNAKLRVHGTLEVDSIISDTRLEKSSSLEFVDDESKVTGKGIVWKPKNSTQKSFVYHLGPERFISSENIDLNNGKHFSIDRDPVLSKTELGRTVKTSYLESLGELTELTVLGDVKLSDVLSIKNSKVTISGSVSLLDSDSNLSLSGNALGSTGDLSLFANGDPEIELSRNIRIGTKDNTGRLVNIYGKVSINVTNPDPESMLSVSGPVVLSGKKFTTGSGIPTSGYWNTGDIVWNETPQEGSYIGWVCTVRGTPGEWKPFGKIG